MGCLPVRAPPDSEALLKSAAAYQEKSRSAGWYLRWLYRRRARAAYVAGQNARAAAAGKRIAAIDERITRVAREQREVETRDDLAAAQRSAALAEEMANLATARAAAEAEWRRAAARRDAVLRTGAQPPSTPDAGATWGDATELRAQIARATEAAAFDADLDARFEIPSDVFAALPGAPDIPGAEDDGDDYGPLILLDPRAVAGGGDAAPPQHAPALAMAL